MSNASDFVIENGVLKKYTGPGGDVVIPEGVTSIGDSAFYGCSSLTSITIPEGVTSIGKMAFYGCHSLTSITIPDSVTSIGKMAFQDCSSLTSITIPDSVTSIGSWAFQDCSSLTSITIPDSVTSIGDSAFQYCSSLTSITIPDSVTSIGFWAFRDCSSLTSITIPDSVTSIGDSAFQYCSSLTSITIPEGVTSIGDSAFEDCRSLTSITIPDSVTSIGSWAFGNCSRLTSITIPEGVTSIGKEAFWGCEKLCTIVVKNPDCTLGKAAFGSTLPTGLVPHIGKLWAHFTDGDLKAYVLNRQIWSMLSADIQVDIFLTRQGKTLLKSYINCVSDSEKLGSAILNRLSASSSAKECSAAANFMLIFSQNITAELLRQMYETLKPLKSAAKALKMIAGEPALMELLGAEMPSEKALSPIERKMIELLKRQKVSVKAPEANLKEYYGLTTSDLPTLKCTDGAVVPPTVAAWLLTVHEKLKNPMGRSTADVVPGYKKPGLCPEAEEIVAELEPASLQEGLRLLAANNLGMIGRSKKMFLAYPICRYADETLMAKLTKTAPSWHSSVSGDDAPPLYTFRSANAYSNTRAAMMFADRYGELKYYAELRSTTEDVIRDQFLSDVGIDENGEKPYDLGNQTVIARLQPDLSFLVALPGGKIAKSIPKKSADAEKYAAANADFSEMKKAVKKIVKNRSDNLFADFLSGRTRDAKDWCASYLHNPLLRSVASLLVWSQAGKTFTLKGGQPVDSAEQAYSIGNQSIAVAHPMEMTGAEITAWQKYFTAHGLKQPFAQIWEPVIDPNTISKTRYKDIGIPYFRFINQAKHGITVEDYDFHDEIEISFAGCDAKVERIDWERHSIDPNHRFEVTEFDFKKYTRQVNHIAGLLDKWTVYGRILKDDISITEQLSQFTLAQITDFIKLASDNNCPNCTAALLEFKNANFSDFNPMEEFTLE